MRGADAGCPPFARSASADAVASRLGAKSGRAARSRSRSDRLRAQRIPVIARGHDFLAAGAGIPFDPDGLRGVRIDDPLVFTDAHEVARLQDDPLVGQERDRVRHPVAGRSVTHATCVEMRDQRPSDVLRRLTEVFDPELRMWNRGQDEPSEHQREPDAAERKRRPAREEPSCESAHAEHRQQLVAHVVEVDGAAAADHVAGDREDRGQQQECAEGYAAHPPGHDDPDGRNYRNSTEQHTGPRCTLAGCRDDREIAQRFAQGPEEHRPVFRRQLVKPAHCRLRVDTDAAGELGDVVMRAIDVRNGSAWSGARRETLHPLDKHPDRGRDTDAEEPPAHAGKGEELALKEFDDNQREKCVQRELAMEESQTEHHTAPDRRVIATSRSEAHRERAPRCRHSLQPGVRLCRLRATRRTTSESLRRVGAGRLRERILEAAEERSRRSWPAAAASVLPPMCRTPGRAVRRATTRRQACGSGRTRTPGRHVPPPGASP